VLHNAFKNNDIVVNYSALRALVVDDYPGMRSAMKMTLSNFGISRIDLLSNATEVLSKLQNQRYDLILCDFNLGDGQDGQQLLEELRHRELVSMETVFIMVTAESGYEKVMATAELGPDDYLVKPFSAESMRSRLDALLLRKRTFAQVYRHIEHNEMDAALSSCDEIIKSKPRFLVDALRFKGEALHSIGRFSEAEGLYRKIVDMRPIPWARLGLARTLFAQKKEDEATFILRDMVDKSPEVVAAYDLLAEVLLSRQDTVGAQWALEQGVAMSAKTVRRQQRLGELALENGDLLKAREAYSNIIDKGRHSIFISAADYGHLCRAQIGQDDLNAALDTLRQGKPLLQASPQGQLVDTVIRSMVHSKNGNHGELERALDEAVQLIQAGARGDEAFMLDYAHTCMTHGRHAQADAVIREIARNAHDSETLLNKVKQIYQRAGRAEAGEELISEATSAVRKLNNEAVILAHKGDFAAAVEKLQSACWEAPYNARVLMNAVWAMLKHLEHNGMSHDLFEEARKHLADAQKLSPAHPRLSSLRGQMREIESRYGMHSRMNG